MWLSGVLLLICHYQMVFASKTIMTNEISMPSLGHKEKVATFHRLQPKDGSSTKYRSARFERLRGAPENIKPIFVEPAVLETEIPSSSNLSPAPIEVVPSSETVTEIPLDFSPTTNEIPTPTPTSFHEFNFGSLPIFKEFPEMTETTSEEPVTTTTEAVTTDESQATPVIHNYAEERVYPSVDLVKPSFEIAEIQPSAQIEVSSTNGVEVEETITTTTVKPPKKRRHRRKHRKLRKITTPTDLPSELTTIAELSSLISTETTTELHTETTTVASTETTTTTTATTTPKPTTAPTTTPIFTSPLVHTFPTSGSTGAKIGESYLGGWNEDEGVIVTTSGPSLGTAINQFSEIPPSIPIDDDKAIKDYYEKYYAEWYQKHNQASNMPVTATSTIPKEIKIELAKKTTSPVDSVTLQPHGISPSTAQPTKEQLDKVCDYVAKISKSFGIKDIVGFAKNNCAFVKSFHPTATCEQIQHLMSYCETGLLVNN